MTLCDLLRSFQYCCYFVCATDARSVSDSYVCFCCSFYKKLACDALRECYASDKHRATLFVVHEMVNYGSHMTLLVVHEMVNYRRHMTLLVVHEMVNYGSHMTPLKLAVLADNSQFVAHPACQDALTAIWYGRLHDDISYLKVVLV